MFRRVFFSCALLLLLSSCHRDVVIDAFQAVPEQGWHYSFKPDFAFTIADKGQPYDLKLNLRITSEYKYANIFVLMRQRDPDGKIQTERVELKLAENDGRWLGDGNGALYSYQASYKKGYFFPDTGKYQIEIEQNMRDNPLPSVSDVGICVVPTVR